MTANPSAKIVAPKSAPLSEPTRAPMTYTRAKLAAIDATIIDVARLNEAASVLLANLMASAEDIQDATDLIYRAKSLTNHREPGVTRGFQRSAS